MAIEWEFAANPKKSTLYPGQKASGLRWDNVGAEAPKEGRELKNAALVKALNLKVINDDGGGDDDNNNNHNKNDAHVCQRVFNEISTNILSFLSFCQPELTQEEWNACGIADLLADDFVRADAGFFSPADKGNTRYAYMQMHLCLNTDVPIYIHAYTSYFLTYMHVHLIIRIPKYRCI